MKRIMVNRLTERSVRRALPALLAIVLLITGAARALLPAGPTDAIASSAGDCCTQREGAALKMESFRTVAEGAAAPVPAPAALREQAPASGVGGPGRLINITAATGLPGYSPPLAGNPSNPVAVSPDGTRIYVAYLSKDPDRKAVLTEVRNGSVLPPVRLNEEQHVIHNPSHDAPSVYMGGRGNLYTNFMQTHHWYASRALQGPPMRRSANPYDMHSLRPSEDLRLFNTSETHGFRMRDGAVLIVGSDHGARIDIVEPDGSYRWPAARQVVTQVTKPKPPEIAEGNRFTKTFFHQGADGNLYAVWGWSQQHSDLPDNAHYTQDSREVYFAWSEDGGVTWKNRTGTKTRSSVLAREPGDWQNLDRNTERGIVQDDDDFRITDMRQREHRRVWVEEDGTVHIAFARSTWCDSGICHERRATEPGALYYLTFNVRKPDEPIRKQRISTDSHLYIAGIREHRGTLYLWSETGGRIYEYRSSNRGATWQRTAISPEGATGCVRVHADHNIPGQDLVAVVFACRDDVFLWTRNLE